MAINIATVTQKQAISPTEGALILPLQISSSLNTAQAIYKFANRVVYSDIREKGLTGYYFNNAPWYCDSFTADDNWIAQVAKLPYRPTSPLPGSNLNTSAAPPGGWINPVGVGDPSLTFYIEGCNIEYFIQVEKVTFFPSTGVVTYGAVPVSKYSNVLPGVYNPVSPWLSTYDTDEVKIGLPDGTTDTSLIFIDFMWRAAQTSAGGNSADPGFVGAFAVWDTPFSDFPAGSY
jgi:hypothetical protein